MKRNRAPLVLLWLAFAWVGAASAGPAGNKAAAPDRAQKTAAKQQMSEGEKVFRANCMRCHNPPETLSPREVRAVVRQMRVRANLSAEEEKALIEFLAP